MSEIDEAELALTRSRLRRLVEDFHHLDRVSARKAERLAEELELCRGPAKTNPESIDVALAHARLAWSAETSRSQSISTWANFLLTVLIAVMGFGVSRFAPIDVRPAWLGNGMITPLLLLSLFLSLVALNYVLRGGYEAISDSDGALSPTAQLDWLSDIDQDDPLSISSEEARLRAFYLVSSGIDELAASNTRREESLHRARSFLFAGVLVAVVAAACYVCLGDPPMTNPTPWLTIKVGAA